MRRGIVPNSPTGSSAEDISCPEDNPVICAARPSAHCAALNTAPDSADGPPSQPSAASSTPLLERSRAWWAHRRFPSAGRTEPAGRSGRRAAPGTAPDHGTVCSIARGTIRSWLLTSGSVQTPRPHCVRRPNDLDGRNKRSCAKLSTATCTSLAGISPVVTPYSGRGRSCRRALAIKGSRRAHRCRLA